MRRSRERKFYLYLVYLTSTSWVATKINLKDSLSNVYCFTRAGMCEAAESERWDVLKAHLPWVSPDFSMNGFTPLDHVLCAGNTDLVVPLLEAGADSGVLCVYAIRALARAPHSLDTIMLLSEGFTKKQLGIAQANAASLVTSRYLWNKYLAKTDSDSESNTKRNTKK